MKVAVPATKTLFGFQSAWFFIPAGGAADLHVQATAEETGASLYGLSIQGGVSQGATTWQDKGHGDSDPTVKVKGGG